MLIHKHIASLVFFWLVDFAIFLEVCMTFNLCKLRFFFGWWILRYFWPSTSVNLGALWHTAHTLYIEWNICPTEALRIEEVC